jgi:hypothetical protein
MGIYVKSPPPYISQKKKEENNSKRTLTTEYKKLLIQKNMYGWGNHTVYIHILKKIFLKYVTL